MKVYNPENLELKDHSSCTELIQTLFHDCKLFYVEFIVEVLRIIDLYYSADCIPRQCEMNKSNIGVWLVLRREWETAAIKTYKRTSSFAYYLHSNKIK